MPCQGGLGRARYTGAMGLVFSAPWTLAAHEQASASAGLFVKVLYLGQISLQFFNAVVAAGVCR
jgi:hypothetical protein